MMKNGLQKNKLLSWTLSALTSLYFMSPHAQARNIFLSFDENYWSTSLNAWEVVTSAEAWTHQYNGPSTQILRLSLSNVPAGTTIKFDWGLPVSSIFGQRLILRKATSTTTLASLQLLSQSNVVVALDEGTYDLDFIYERTSTTGGYSYGYLANVYLNTAPGLTALPTLELGATTMTLRSTSDELAKSRILYGSTASLGSATTLDSNFQLAHSATISSWPSNTALYFKIENTDAGGQVYTSPLFRSFSRPKILTAVSAQSLQLSWVADPDQWILEESDSTGPTAVYTPVLGSPTNGGGLIQRMNLSRTATQKYFRLKRSSAPGVVVVQ